MKKILFSSVLALMLSLTAAGCQTTPEPDTQAVPDVEMRVEHNQTTSELDQQELHTIEQQESDVQAIEAASQAIEQAFDEVPASEYDDPSLELEL